MAEKESIDFKKTKDLIIKSVPTNKINPDFPLESFLAEYQWQNSRATVTFASGAILSTHIDLDGDKKITRKELRDADAAASFLNNAIAISPDGDKHVGESIAVQIPKTPAQPNDQDVVASPKTFLDNYLKVVPNKTPEEIKKIEDGISKFLKGTDMESKYKPDGKLTLGELQYYNSFPATSTFDNSKAISTELNGNKGNAL